MEIDIYVQWLLIYDREVGEEQIFQKITHCIVLKTGRSKCKKIHNKILRRKIFSRNR